MYDIYSNLPYSFVVSSKAVLMLCFHHCTHNAFWMGSYFLDDRLSTVDHPKYVRVRTDQQVQIFHLLEEMLWAR